MLYFCIIVQRKLLRRTYLENICNCWYILLYKHLFRKYGMQKYPFHNKFIDKDVDIFAAGEEWWVLLRLLQLSNGDDQQVSKDLFIKPKSEHCLALSLTKSLIHSSCWDLNDVTLACGDSRNLSKSHETSPCCTLQNLAKPHKRLCPNFEAEVLSRLRS